MKNPTSINITNLELLFKIFSDKNRLKILGFLYQKKLCVCELTFLLGITQPNLSKHIRKLNELSILCSEQDGLWTNYSINKDFLNHNKEILLPMLKTILQLPEVKTKSKILQKLNREKLSGKIKCKKCN